LDKSFQDQTAPDVSARDWATIASEIQNLLLPASSIDDTPILHSLTVEQRRQLIAWIDSAVEQLPAQMKGLTDKLEALEREERSISKKIQQVPSDEVANPLISEFESLSRQQGELEEQRKQIEKEMSQLEHQLAEADRNRKKCWETLSKSEDADIRVQRAAKVQVILDEYLAQITEVKLTELEQQIAYYFNLLCRKNMAIEEVKIDRKRFMVRLYGKNRVELAKSSLSAVRSSFMLWPFCGLCALFRGVTYPSLSIHPWDGWIANIAKPCSPVSFQRQPTRSLCSLRILKLTPMHIHCFSQPFRTPLP